MGVITSDRMIVDSAASVDKSQDSFFICLFVLTYPQLLGKLLKEFPTLSTISAAILYFSIL